MWCLRFVTLTFWLLHCVQLRLVTVTLSDIYVKWCYVDPSWVQDGYVYLDILQSLAEINPLGCKRVRFTLISSRAWLRLTLLSARRLGYLDILQSLAEINPLYVCLAPQLLVVEPLLLDIGHLICKNKLRINWNICKAALHSWCP